MRKPKLDEVPPIETTQSGLITQVREYELITPLFGGGVTPGQVDSLTPVRGTEIRGHLRFWWRATCGGRFDGDLEKMKAAEDKLWGAASTANKPSPSQVQVQVDVLDQGRPFVARDKQGNPVDISHFKSLYSYVAFPLENRQFVKEGIQFKLKLTFPHKQRGEIEAALWAWETFGGVGARTRRGFGALRCVKIDDKPVLLLSPNQIRQDIQQGLNKYIIQGTWPDNLPHLTQNVQFKITRSFPDALTAWRQLFDPLKSFRQARNRSSASSQPGRSKWPEPDAIRKLTGRSSKQHAQALSNIDKFPRAAFGLPIVFQFKDEKSGDPRISLVQGVNVDRLASPLILRPKMCLGNVAVGIALILNTPQEPPGGLILKGAPGNPKINRELTKTEAQHIQPLGGKTDILKAFLDRLEGDQ